MKFKFKAGKGCPHKITYEVDGDRVIWFSDLIRIAQTKRSDIGSTKTQRKVLAAAKRANR